MMKFPKYQLYIKIQTIDIDRFFNFSYCINYTQWNEHKTLLGGFANARKIRFLQLEVRKCEGSPSKDTYNN
jgi:hypothetical protein